MGFFSGEDDDLVFQDEVHGPLMLQVDEVIKLLKERYLIHAISYVGHHRREAIQYPEDSLRESVLQNHKVTNSDVQKMLNVSRATAMRLLQRLDTLLEPVGHGAGSYYRIRNY